MNAADATDTLPDHETTGNAEPIEVSEIETIEGQIISFSLDKVEHEDIEKKSQHRTRKIRGFANKNIVDRGNQRIEPMAFAKSKEGFMRNPVLLANHDWSTPIGRIEDFEVTPQGLIIEATLGSGFDEADKIWAMIEQDLVRSFSVGLRPFEIEVDENGIEVITDLELFEVSVVTIPMNAESTFEVTSKGEIKNIMVKGLNGDTTYKEFIASHEDESDEDTSKLEKTDITEENSDVQAELIFTHGACNFCDVKGHVVHCATSVYGENFYSCLACTSKAFEDYEESIPPSVEDVAAQYEEKLVEATEVCTALAEHLHTSEERIASLEKLAQTLSVEKAKLTELLKATMVDVVKSAAKNIIEV